MALALNQERVLDSGAVHRAIWKQMSRKEYDWCERKTQYM